jgi:hypothetical protein
MFYIYAVVTIYNDVFTGHLFPEDGGSKFFQNIGKYPLEHRRHAPENSNLHCLHFLNFHSSLDQKNNG